MRRRLESAAELAASESAAPPADNSTPLGALVDEIASALVAGIGLGGALLIVAMLAGASTLYAPALATGALWAMAQLFARRARNPLEIEWRLWQAAQAIRRLAAVEAERDAARAERDDAVRSAAAWAEACRRVQADTQRARAPSFVAAVTPQEEQDAWNLIVRRYRDGQPVSKEFMMRQGWPKDRYLAATRLLNDRGFFTANNRWIECSYDEARLRWAGKGRT